VSNVHNVQGNHRAGRTLRLVPQALVVAVLVGGTGAYVLADKTVRITVDGQPRTVRTLASDVADVLRQEGIRVGGHDIVAPAPRQPLHDGDRVAVRYGRPLTFTLDGQRRRVWTTGTTVAQALRQLGVRADGAHLDVSRDAAIGRRGLTLDVLTRRRVTVVADGRAHLVRTHAVTVLAAVGDAGLVLGAEDTTSPAPGAFPRDGQTVTVVRVRTAEVVRHEAVPYRVVRHRDPALARGTTVLDVPGRPGAREVRYAVRTVDGVRRSARVLGARVTREPVTEVVRIGSRSRRAGPRRDGLDWHGLAQCESGGRPRAVDPSGRYGGLYQFDAGTWRSLGGRGRPQDAPPSEQTARAQRLYAARGATPWPSCGHRLSG
jgi:uncharacterized protein YabE (DUF348 family)